MNLDVATSYVMVSLFFSLIIAFPIISLLYKFNITRRGEVDFSNLIEERKKKVGTPIMGGLIIVITVITINLFLNRDPDQALSGSVKIPLVIFGISAVLGMADDLLNIFGNERKIRSFARSMKLMKVHKSILKRIILFLLIPWLLYKRLFFMLGSNPGKGIQAHEKVLIQGFTGMLLAYWIIFLTGWTNPTELNIPFYGFIDLGVVLMTLFITFSVISFTNAVNLSDGMDGLAAGLFLIACLVFLVISMSRGDVPNSILLLTLIGSCTTYLYFNAPPARFQMGDVGSLALGTMLASIAFSMEVPLLLPIIGFPFVAEVGSSLIQGLGRRVLGRRIFLMAPLHHHFEMKGWNEEKVVIRMWVMGIFSAIIGLWVYFVGMV